MAQHQGKMNDLSMDEEKSIYNTPNTTLTLEDVLDNNISGFDANTSFINAELGLNANVKSSPNNGSTSLNSTLYNTDSDVTLNSSTQSVRSNNKRKFDETATDEETEVLSDTLSLGGQSTPTSPISSTDEPAGSGLGPAEANASGNTSISQKPQEDIPELEKIKAEPEKIEEPEKVEGVYDEYLNCYLPRTVTILTAPKNCRVYLVGTVHFSRESHEDVSKVIRAVQPDVVLVELCKSRLSFLELDEEAMLEAVNLSFSTMMDIIKEKGVVNGMLFVLLLSLSARITKMLNMAPGGEFRRALKEVWQGCQFCDLENFKHKYLPNHQRYKDMPRNTFVVLPKIYKFAAGHKVVSLTDPKIFAFKFSQIAKSGNTEAEKVPGCKFVLGDRPLSITVKRVVASLSWCMTLRLWWNLLTSLGQDVSTEDLEKLKHTDLLEELLKELSKDFPDVGNVFVNERDIFIAHHLQLLAKPHLDGDGREVPTKVVGVVGIGHAPGIAAKMGKVTSDDVIKIMIVPPPSMTSRVIRVTIRASLIGVVVYGVTRVVPVHRWLPSVSQIKSFVLSSLPDPSK